MKNYPTWKRYTRSSVRTFIGAFGVVFVAQLQTVIESGLLTSETLQAAMMAAATAGVVSVLKLADEFFSGFDK